MKLKTRTNQPVYYKLPVSSNIQSLSDDLLNSLKVGDVVQKKTGNAKHCYIVTYKEEKHGICLSYFDGSGYLETISYDYTDGHWVYNSKDVCKVVSQENLVSSLANKDVTVKTLTTTSHAKIFERIIDSDNHQRYQLIPFTPSTESGVTYTYSKAILNGYSLRIILAGKIDANKATFSKGNEITLPAWIWNKIQPARDDNAISSQNIETFASVSTITSSLFKITSNRIMLYVSNTTQSEDVKYFRAEYNLVIE